MEDNRIDLRLKLEQMTTPELTERFQTETEKEVPDDDLVLLILDILEERDADKPVELGPQSQAAWQNYQSKVRARARKPVIRLNWIAKAASFVLIIGVLAAAFLPQQATAGNFWKILTSWTDDLFRYENIGTEETTPKEYVFETDNPGLQQVYEAVLEKLEITEPVVVKWLPGKPELEELLFYETPAMNSVYARLVDGESETILVFDKMGIDLSPQYDKVAVQVEKYELNGVTHHFVRNNDLWLISWSNNNVKCSVFIDCQEEVLRQIVRSIY